MRDFRYILPLTILSMLIALASCTQDAYETGDGAYSYMRADFAEAYTDNNGKVTKAITDDNETLTFHQPLKVEGMSTPDSVYRILLYYNKVENNIEPLNFANVLTPTVHDIKDTKNKAIDPVQFDSSWMSRNGKYINFGLTIKAGTTDENNKQFIGMALESCTECPDGTKEAQLLLTHDQNGVPEYYSIRTFMSIATDQIPCELKDGDKLTFVINTYKGKIKKTFQIHL